MEEIFTENSFYYFYSTVPQVLAGGIALIGAFLIFFIAESNKKMFKILRDTWVHINNRRQNSYYNEIANCVKEKYKIDLEELEYIDKDSYMGLFDRIFKCSKGEDSFIGRNYSVFKIEFDLKSNVIKKGIRSVVLSGILMAVCIFILPFVQFLIKALPLGIVITLLVFSASCYAIYLIADMVIQAIQKL